MALTNHESIRTEAGYQHKHSKVSFSNSTGVSTVAYYVNTDDPIKIVPNFGTGTTIAGVSDVKVWQGLSGIALTQLTVSSVDPEVGVVTLSTPPASGSSLIIDFASSPLPSNDIEAKRLQAESMVNQRLSLCYNLPLTPVPSMITSLASRLAAALLLIRDYGVGARSTSKDGYMLYEQLMGKKEVPYSDSGQGTIWVGEIGMLCSPGYQIVDDTGVIIPRNDEDNIDGGEDFQIGGRVVGRLFNITDETVRFKDYQVDANQNQAGSGNYDPTKIQG